MKRLLLISILLISATLSNAQKTTKDTTPCKTYVQFTNKTTLSLEIEIYSKQGMNSQDYVRTIYVPIGKSKKMKAEDGETYYYRAKTKVDESTTCIIVDDQRRSRNSENGRNWEENRYA